MSGLFLGGIFNIVDPIVGQQLYKWSWVFLIICAGAVWLIYRYGRWEPYRPLWGMYYAYKGKSRAAFIFNRRLHAELVSERDAKCIFDYSKAEYEGMRRWGDFNRNGTGMRIPIVSSVLDFIQMKLWYYPTAFLEIDPLTALMYKLGGVNMDVEIAKKMQSYEWDDTPAINSGGILIDIILDADNWTVKDSPQHKIIETTTEKWNELNPNDQIHSYTKFYRKIKSGEIKCPDGISIEIVVPWVRMDAGCPVTILGAQQAGAKRQEAKDVEEENTNPLSKYYYPIIIGTFGIAALILILRFASTIL